MFLCSFTTFPVYHCCKNLPKTHPFLPTYDLNGKLPFSPRPPKKKTHRQAWTAICLSGRKNKNSERLQNPYPTIHSKDNAKQLQNITKTNSPRDAERFVESKSNRKCSHTHKIAPSIFIKHALSYDILFSLRSQRRPLRAYPSIWPPRGGQLRNL